MNQYVGSFVNACACMCVNMSVCVCACVWSYACVCMCVCMCVCTCVCVCARPRVCNTLQHTCNNCQPLTRGNIFPAILLSVKKQRLTRPFHISDVTHSYVGREFTVLDAFICVYEVATICRLLKIVGLFCRI